MNVNEALKLYLVMGSTNCPRPATDIVKEAIEGGITLFQYREKGEGCLKGDARHALATDLMNLCHGAGIPFIVNDDVQLALDVDADGVHIGQDDGSIEEVRRRIGSKWLGVSTHNVEEARLAVQAGADYIGVGPMFMTKTKADIQEVQGPSVIRMIRDYGIDIPIVGIGGIDVSNMHEVMVAGADGVAVISAISQAENPRASAHAFKTRLRSSKQTCTKHTINHS
ncbi:thiamine phosphate synthase [Pseudalkalibacillus berkeleyi]|uniref:Thiamine-phosphate synthase n=1 Tax=Pseudalkalibacillus berkeleyi TaxID=1069813 RepID=A0ABS9H565_9BACL|nr:thiamine phosphate synthase [Pseudalkalibacillus berkeleyi]MCF6139246.1 thiamine phosphate synthase [Pseudalkalibacillus berkeleyi]